MPLFYVTSLYTRDWRPLVPHPEQQVVSRPRALAYAVPADPGETAARLEPDTTGALPRMAERIARGPAAGRVTRQSASAVSRSQAQAVAPRSRGQHKPNKHADVAAPAVEWEEVGLSPFLRPLAQTARAVFPQAAFLCGRLC